MSGLLALLDDVAGIAKMAAATVDDVVGQAAKAGAKAAGAAIDDAAVTPKYLDGMSPARELPVVWRIARGSLVNKLAFLLPAGLAMSALAPWMIPPLLMLGGGYLCFEGAEKVAHRLGLVDAHGADGGHAAAPPAPGRLEEARVAGAIKTDFILSAEIMTIALSEIPKAGFWIEAATLATVAVGITVLVYGAVALIVKADDLGLHLARTGQWRPVRALGRGVVRAMPSFMRALTVVGTAAMLWVGAAIITHALAQMGWPALYDAVHAAAKAAARAVGSAEGLVGWIATAGLEGVIGLAIGMVLVPVAAKALVPAWTALSRLRPGAGPDGR